MLGMYMVRGYLDQQLAEKTMTLQAKFQASTKTDAALNEENMEWLPETSTVTNLRLLDVWIARLRVFVSRIAARQWIGTYVPALGCTQATLKSIQRGREKVLHALKHFNRGDFGG